MLNRWTPDDLLHPPTTTEHSLPPELISRLEPLFGIPLVAIRIHIAPKTNALGALAFTQVSDIFFAPGYYDPTNIDGQMRSLKPYFGNYI